MAIPIDDPTLPSYRCPMYKAMSDDWGFVEDMYKGRRAWLNDSNNAVTSTIDYKSRLYLPQEPDEKDANYLNRIRRSSFHRKFGNAIDAFAGILSRFAITSDNMPENEKECFEEDVDRRGNSLARFLVQADIKALRDGTCYILVDFPPRPIKPDGSELTYAEEQQLNLRPSLVLYDARQLVNWQVGSDGGQSIELVTLREVSYERVGRYGIGLVERYRVLYPGGGELYKVVKVSDTVEELILEQTWVSTAPVVTLIPYSIAIGASSVFGEDKPPFLDLAELNLRHYQKMSEKDEVMHKCNIPLLEINRKGGTLTGATGKNVKPGDPPKDQPSISIGPSTVLWNVDARYVEPTGAALALTMQDIADLEAAMTQKTLDFLTLGDVAKTATEVVHTAAPLSASLSGMVVAKESLATRIFEYWQIYSGQDYEAGIVIDEGAMRAAINSSTVDRLMAIRAAGDLSRRSFLELIQEARILPSSLDVEEELMEIANEFGAPAPLPELPEAEDDGESIDDTLPAEDDLVVATGAET
jgi:hypothetical protein